MNADVFDEANLIRKDINIIYSTSDEEIAEFDDFGNLKTKKTGKVILTAKVDELESQLNLDVIKNPIKELTINSSKDKIRTGDVLHFIVNAFDRRKNIIADAPIEYSYKGKADYGIGFPASAQITLDGRFVAETAGMYTIYASSNGLIVNKTIKVVNRNVGKELKLIGHGLISDVYTSDLWLWPGIGKHEGKDFAVTGTWGANGEAYFWDVTDPSNMTIIDTITVDARTVNDVKISGLGYPPQGYTTKTQFVCHPGTYRFLGAFAQQIKADASVWDTFNEFKQRPLKLQEWINFCSNGCN